MLAMAQAGADVIELGVPFSDPMADGPVIQKASERALAKGIGMSQVLGFVRAFRERNAVTPVVLMGYANPIERYGIPRFIADAKAAGVDGVLVVDYPPEEAETLRDGVEGRCARSDLPARADIDRTAHEGRRPHRQWLCLLRVAEGRDRAPATSTPMRWRRCCRASVSM